MSSKKTEVEMTMQIVTFLCAVSFSDQNAPDKMLCKWAVYHKSLDQEKIHWLLRIPPSMPWRLSVSSPRSREEIELLFPHVSQIFWHCFHHPAPQLSKASLPGRPLRLKTSERPLGLRRLFIISLKLAHSTSPITQGPQTWLLDDCVIVSGKQDPSR